MLKGSASTSNYRTVSVNFSIGTDSDISTGFQQILSSPNHRVKAHLESFTKAPAADSNSDTHLESSIK